MIRVILLTLLISLSTPVEAKLLDKILAVINDKMITLSQTNRIIENFSARTNISPQLYRPKIKKNQRKIVQLQVRRIIIRHRLAETGFIIGDDQVDTQIKSTEKRLGLNRKALLQFLTSNGVTFDEYFELIRETIEYNIFSSRIIRPLVSITDQEIKNYYYKHSKNKKTLNFKYNLIDFSIKKSKVKKRDISKFQKALVGYQKTGTLPTSFSSLETNIIDDISSDGLNASLSRKLKRTKEGGFSKVVTIGKYYHVFFVKSKNLVESEKFTENKARIREILFKNVASSVEKEWFKREEIKHYVKYFF